MGLRLLLRSNKVIDGHMDNISIDIVNKLTTLVSRLARLNFIKLIKILFIQVELLALLEGSRVVFQNRFQGNLGLGLLFEAGHRSLLDGLGNYWLLAPAHLLLCLLLAVLFCLVQVHGLLRIGKGIP